MKITDFSIKRPLTIAVLVTVVLILGGVSLSRLNIDLYPEMNLPVAVVMTEYPGAGPQEVENMITRPLESILGTVSDLDSIQSVSSTGSSTVIVMFNWGTDMNFAALQMREKVDIIKSFFPDDAGNPTVFKMDPNMLPIMQMSVSGGDPVQVKQVADDVIQPRLERVPGVAAVRVEGGAEREIKVLADPARLQGYGFSLNQIVQVLQAENMNISGGHVEEGKKDLLVRATGEFRDLNDIRNLVLTSPTGTRVHLGDLAEVLDGAKESTSISRVNGKPGLTILIHKQSVANTVQVAREVKKALQDIEKDIPADFEIGILLDQSEFIEQSIQSVVHKIFFGGLLAMLVMLVFLRNLRSTLIISTAIPISIVFTFVLLYFNDMTLNLFSLGGLALGVGLIVDDAIVVLENIYRHRQQGYSRMDAARVATDEVGNAVIASTLTTIAVFLPIVFVEGLASQLFKPMALTVSFSVAASLAVALTLVPLLASRFLKLTETGEGTFSGRVFGASERWFDRLHRRYEKILAWSLGHRKRVIIAVALLFVGSLALTPLVGAEFMPVMDEGYVKVQVDMPNGTGLEETDRCIAVIEKLGEQIPEVKNIYASIGFTGSESMGGEVSSDRGQIFFELVDKEQRSRSTEDVAEEMRDLVRGIPGADIKVSATGPASEGQGMGSPVQVDIKGDDLDTLTRLADEVTEIIEKVPGTRQVTNNLADGLPELRVRVDRERAALYGLSGAEISSTLRTAIQGTVATQYRTGEDEIDVRVQLANAESARMADLQNLTVMTGTGVVVPLHVVTDIIEREAPSSINRQDQTRMVSVTANLSGRDLGSVMKDIRARLDQLPLPPGYFIEYGGQNEEMMKAFGNLGLALILAIVLVYLVMVAQFESLLYPFIIMFSVPVTIIGVVLSLLMSGRPFSVPAFIGIILLAGIVVKNAIVLVDYVNVLRRRGVERNEAILKAGPTRLRPILMTALTAVLAMLPMALGIGEGSEGQAPMATVVVGGLLFSTLITLVLVPVVYTILDDLGGKFRRKKPPVPGVES
ncbi:efflux RND transporter permease subunit [Desulfoscipio geothermicus]|uniref:Hydrophobic/amphiphilic exporter-1, HAE1 family n=1 Tax=Desulfoscipio geothermicus DSM 3669 TaxID=1121426 RepID=A0A1I6E8R0_9FIRM|nr:efflux RND transporter permease subunit [Desulfoscipio geothermicus]SFR14114.1 hydrophobic/amphiphilic exporter-1, HAE1 family [Desulfoscipio geothermicus DSM 3669]